MPKKSSLRFYKKQRKEEREREGERERETEKGWIAVCPKAINSQ